MIKTTLRDVINFANSASRWMATQEKQPQTKLSYAVARMLKRCQKPIEDYNAKIEDIRLNNALEDEKTKEVLTFIDPMGRQQYKFSKAGMVKIIEEQRKLLDGEIEIEPYIATTALHATTEILALIAIVKNDKLSDAARTALDSIETRAGALAVINLTDDARVAFEGFVLEEATEPG